MKRVVITIFFLLTACEGELYFADESSAGPDIGSDFAFLPDSSNSTSIPTAEETDVPPPEDEDPPPGPICGDGVIDDGETCDGDCPTACESEDACMIGELQGRAEECDAFCQWSQISECLDGDGCCAPGCHANNDSDCEPVCGNGQVEPGEICDGNCPSSCPTDNACIVYSLEGGADTCDAQCVGQTISACVNNDGCCPAGCTIQNDNDCQVDCTDPNTWPGNWNAMESEVIALVNQIRAQGANCGSEGVFGPAGPVQMQTQLRQASRCHSVYMGDVLNNAISHTGEGGSSFSQRAADAGYTGQPRGENVAAGQHTAQAVVNAWMNSAGHCRNIMQPDVNRMGVGYYYRASAHFQSYWTMKTGRNG